MSAMIPVRLQKGLSLVEMMVGLTVGLLILAATLAMYLSASRGGRDTLNAAKLNMELRGAMDVMVEEIRRAGAGGSGATNPFANPGSTDLSVSQNGSCIEFAYDADGNGQLATAEPFEFFGFRVQGGALWMRNGGAGNVGACANGAWERLTDPAHVTIQRVGNAPYFAITYQCMNTATGNAGTGRCVAGNAVFDDAAGGTMVNLLELREVAINIGGQLVNDPAMRMSLSQRVLVRNHRVQPAGTP